VDTTVGMEKMDLPKVPKMGFESKGCMAISEVTLAADKCVLAWDF